jgi:hypothetical protein
MLLGNCGDGQLSYSCFLGSECRLGDDLHSSSFGLRAMLIFLAQPFARQQVIQNEKWVERERNFIRSKSRTEFRNQEKSTSCIIPWYNGNSAIFRCTNVKSNISKSRK